MEVVSDAEETVLREISKEDKNRRVVCVKKQMATAFAKKVEKAGFSSTESALDSLRKVAIFTHHSPDIDAMSSMMGIEFLFRKKYGAECSKFYTGRISHPQNIALDNLLDAGMQPITEYEPDSYCLRVLIDTIPINAGIETDVDFDVVIDHHPDLPNGEFKGLAINLKAGSCAATVYELIVESGVEFNGDNDYDVKIATALIAGIYTDTDHMLSVDTTEFERNAFGGLAEVADTDNLRKIIFYKRPKAWIDAKSQAYKNAYIDDEGYAIVGMSFLPEKHWDLLADQTDEMVQWDTCHTAIAFAVIGTDTLVGCVRSVNPSITVKEVCKKLAGNHGQGGGKQGKGRYHYDLGSQSIDPEEDEEIKEELWQLLNKREKNRILRILKK